MQKLKLYALHTDGRKLYYPQWDASGEIIDTKHPTAAVTIDHNGTTFPAGSVWIRKPRSSGLQAGWKFADQGKKKRDSDIENKDLASDTMRQDSISAR